MNTALLGKNQRWLKRKNLLAKKKNPNLMKSCFIKIGTLFQQC